MFDYRVVCVYPVPHETEGLEALDRFIVNEIEQTIAGSIGDGWEYVLTSSIRDSRPITDPSARRAQTFVYRKSRLQAHFAKDHRNVSIAGTFAKIVRDEGTANDDTVIRNGAAQPPISSKTLLKIAILSAVRNHKRINPETVLTELQKGGEISKGEERALRVYMTQEITAANLAGLTPTAMASDVFTASLLPFGHEDDDYVENISELACHLDLEESFVSSSIKAKQVALSA